MASIIGHRQETWAGAPIETMYRLSRPLQDVSYTGKPDSFNIVVQIRNGERTVLRGCGYQTADGSWKAVPRGSWVSCCHPLTARDMALVNEEIEGIAA